MNHRDQSGSNGSVRPFGTIRAFKLAGLAVASGCAFVWWLRAPVLDIVGIQGWRAAGVFSAAVIGGVGVVMIGTWLRVIIAMAVGLLAGAAWAEFWLTDVRVGLIDSFVAAISNHGQGLILPGVGAALLGALVTQVLLGKTTRQQHRPE